MPYLDWTKSSPQVLAKHDSRGKLHLELNLDSKQINVLGTSLEELYANNGNELRLGVDAEWLLFWKRRDDGNRILVAHPEDKSWVATIALENTTGLKLASSLKLLQSGQKLNLNQMGLFASVSNLEVTLIVCA